MNIVCKCGCTHFFTESKGNAVGLYCRSCGKWQKWLTKDEVRLFEHDLLNGSTANLRDRLMKRINESAIKVSTVKSPHTYMKAVGTKELEKIIEEEIKADGS